MNICFYGVGGVGGYYGALVASYLNNKNRGHTSFIARGKHKEAILDNGLLLKKEGGKEAILVTPDSCTDTVENLPVFEIVVVSVKSYDLEQVSKDLSKITDENSVILPLLNGADIYDRMRLYFKKGYVLPACLYLGTHIESPGVIFQNGGSGQILVGRDPLKPAFYPENLLNLFADAAIWIEFFEDVNVQIWTKYMFIASYALVTATYGKTIGAVAKDSALSTLVKNIMQEIELIAKALDIELPADIVETSFTKANQFPPETKTSFQRDVESKGRQSEWDLFGGTILRYAERLNIKVENTKLTFDMLMQNMP